MRHEVKSGHVGARGLPGVAEITDQASVKAAAKAWGTFSSDTGPSLRPSERLLGDSDVRTYRHLPLEVDPPAHTDYRAILTPIFGRQEVGALEPAFRAAARGLVGVLARRGSAEAVRELALPMVAASIGIALGRPQDVAELEGWGVSAWHTRPDGTRDGSHIDAYLTRTFDEVLVRPGADAFSRIAGGSIGGRPLSRHEMVGMGSLVLAGGRETVIHLIVGALWHLASHREARVRLAADPARIPAAVDELLRFLSPAPRIERVATDDVAGPWGHASRGDMVLLGLAAANHDAAVFAEPGVVQLDRSPNPHVAFGNGPHTCIGVHLARIEVRIFLEELLAEVPDWRVGAGARFDVERFGGSEVPVRFHALPIEVGA